jgi:succinylglutamate desuccinylase
MLTLLDHIPDGLLQCSARDLQQLLPGPTLIQLPGRRPQPLFVSVLLHGNETTGLTAIQSLLEKYQQQELPRALSIFIGNVSAARHGLRHLQGQPDYNRIWPCPGFDNDCIGNSPEHQMMQQIIEIMREQQVFASIDVHNNTGLNPHYGCVNRLDSRFFHLATLFSRTVVYFIRPQGVQSMAFSDLCPAVTVECGKADQPHGAAHAMEFIDTCLHLSELPDHPVAAHDMDLFHTVATVTVPEDINIAFSEANAAEDTAADIHFVPDLDHLNFRELSSGITLGRIHPARQDIPLRVTDEQGEEVTKRYFQLEAGELRTVRNVMPSMFTLDVEVIHQDCLGYLMERVDWQSA